MENNKIKLPDKFIKYLETQPEQGMGYQIVNLELVNGDILENRIILNSMYLKLNNDEKLEVSVIKEIKINI